VVRRFEHRLIVDDWNALASPWSLLLMPELKTIPFRQKSGSGNGCPDDAVPGRIKNAHLPDYDRLFISTRSRNEDPIKAGFVR